MQRKRFLEFVLKIKNKPQTLAPASGKSKKQAPTHTYSYPHTLHSQIWVNEPSLRAADRKGYGALIPQFKEEVHSQIKQ